MGGVGKTRLAQEYAHQYSSDYEWIFWARAESSTELLNSYNAFARKIKIDAADQNTIERVRDWFQTTGI